MAWNATVRVVGARLHREVAVADRRVGSRRPRSVGIGDERGRLARRDAERVAGRSNSDAPKPKVSVSDDGPRPIGLAGVVGRRVLVGVVGADRAARRSCDARPRVQSCSSCDELVAVVGDARRTTRTAAGPAPA